MKEFLLERMGDQPPLPGPPRNVAFDPATGAPLWSATAPDDEHWTGSFHVNGLNGPVVDLLNHDGELFAGGGFREAGRSRLNYVTRWDGADWQPVGSGMDDWVFTLGTYGGDLVAGGDFKSVGGRSARAIALWDGTSWEALGDGLRSESGAWVAAIAEHDGDLYAGGYFQTAGGSPAANLARWDGQEWHAVGAGFNSSVLALASWNGDLYAAGRFTASADGVTPLSHVARLVDGAWEPVGEGVNDYVLTLAVHDGALVAGGYFSGSGATTTQRVAQWDGEQWKAVGGGLDELVWRLLDIDGKLWAAGAFDGNIASLNAEFWFSRTANTNDIAVAIAPSQGGVVVGGYFKFSNQTPANYAIQEFRGVWVPMQGTSGAGLSGPVYDTIVWRGDLVATGEFVVAGGNVVYFVARWDGQEWHGMGGGLDGYGGRSLAVFNNDLVVSGLFEHAGGNDAVGVARWDGEHWHAMGDGLNGAALSMVEYRRRLVAGGFFTMSGPRVVAWIAQFDGGIWTAMGDGVRRDVYDMVVYNDLLMVGGNFREIPGYGKIEFLASWDGRDWAPVVDVGGPVGALTVHQGDLIVSGAFTSLEGVPAQGIARFDGTNWHALGQGLETGVYALHTYGNDLIAAGKFNRAEGNYTNRISRWNGEAWLPMGSGVDDEVLTLNPVGTRLYVGGRFSHAGGKASSFLAVWDDTVTPVRLTGFAAHREGTAGVVDWTVTGEPADHLGFHLYREDAPDQRVRINPDLLTGAVTYRYHDPSPPGGRVQYWLQEISRTGESTWFGPAALDPAVSPTLSLTLSHPNPFRLATSIRGVNPTTGRVTLRVFDSAGRETARPWDDQLPAGPFEIPWDGRSDSGAAVPAGVFFYRLDTPAGSVTRKLVKIP